MCEKGVFSKMTDKRLNRRQPFSIGFEPVHQSLYKNLVEIRQVGLKIELPQTLKKTRPSQKQYLPGGNELRNVGNFFIHFTNYGFMGLSQNKAN